MNRLWIGIGFAVVGCGVGFMMGALRLPPYGLLKSFAESLGLVRVVPDAYSSIKRSGFESLIHRPKIVMLGDSLTDHGEWSELLAGEDIVNRGISGQTTGGVLERLNEVIVRRPERVFILVGINDLASGIAPEVAFANITEIAKVLKRHGIHPVVQSILFVRESFQAGLNKKVKSLNDLLVEWCGKNDVVFVDLNSRVTENSQLKESMTVDGLHLSGLGYSVWAEMVREVLDSKAR